VRREISKDSDDLRGRIVTEAVINPENGRVIVNEGVSIGSNRVNAIRALPEGTMIQVKPYVAGPSRNGGPDDSVIWLSADKEEQFKIAQANARLDELNQFLDDRIEIRVGDQYTQGSPSEADLMDVSPMQIMSVSAALIPFLEHDDANRALMGSNMQRQAVPLLRPEAPTVGTGIEDRVARDSGQMVTSEVNGVVTSVNGREIVVTDVDGEGHAHVYVDGEKVGRAYGEWFHLKGVAPGDREIRVTLQTNGHSEYAVDGQPVQAVTTLSVPAMPPAPEEVGQVEAPAGMDVAISLEPDPVGGANLMVMPQGFTLAPEHVNAPNVAGQGHPHVYVNGVRLGRVYSPYLHMGKLAPGMNEVRVTLNTNMHQEYARNGETLEALATIHIPDPGASEAMPMGEAGPERTGVTGLANSLVVEVTHLAADMSASGVSRQMALSPLPGESGGYVAPFIPTAPGPYRFRFVGTIDGVAIDESFTSGDGRFDDVRSATEAQFPRSVPSAREIAGVAAAAQQQARDASDASATALTVAVAGLAIGGLALIAGVGLALYAFSRRGAR